MSDLIERAAAQTELMMKCERYTLARESHGMGHVEWSSDLISVADAMDAIRDLPTAQPERKKGKWIKLDMHAHLADHKCTACGQECYVPTCMGEPMYTYCPNCGADMREEQDG